VPSVTFQIHETIESINQLKIQRDFMLSFSRDPKGYIQDWLKSQSRDLKVQGYFSLFLLLWQLKVNCLVQHLQHLKYTFYSQ